MQLVAVPRTQGPSLNCRPVNPTGLSFYIIDDDESVRTAIGRLLLVEDIKSTTFGSAEDFLAFLEHAPDDRRAAVGRAIVDFHLPGMRGLDLATFAQRTYPELRVVLVTGSENPRTRILASQAGIPLLLKPFDDVALFAAIAATDSQSAVSPTQSDCPTAASNSLERNG